MSTTTDPSGGGSPSCDGVPVEGVEILSRRPLTLGHLAPVLPDRNRFVEGPRSGRLQHLERVTSGGRLSAASSQNCRDRGARGSGNMKRDPVAT